MMIVLSALASAVLAEGSSKNFAFFSIGDVGGAALEIPEKLYYKDTVYAVAKGMNERANTAKPQFIVNTGDNFYWCGIQNTSDYQIQEDFVKPYLQYDNLKIDWITGLGNHEYGYNVDAQTDLHDIIDEWYMPDRYYTRRVQLSTDQYLTIMMVDTSPCISKYRKNDSSGWDPCMTEYPTCSITNGDDDFEGKCMFHENIMSQDCAKQSEWIDEQLSKVDDDDWLIIVGHHCSDEVDEKDFTTQYQKHGFDLYLNGHVHTLTHYSVDGDKIYVTSGAGALLKTESQEDYPTKIKAAGGHVDYNGHKYKTLWNQPTPGFTQHTFSSDFTSLTTTFYDFNGEELYYFEVEKGDRLKRRAQYAKRVVDAKKAEFAKQE